MYSSFVDFITSLRALEFELQRSYLQSHALQLAVNAIEALHFNIANLENWEEYSATPTESQDTPDTNFCNAAFFWDGFSSAKQHYLHLKFGHPQVAQTVYQSLASSSMEINGRYQIVGTEPEPFTSIELQQLVGQSSSCQAFAMGPP
ncbi:hypothetical protein C8J56DRAFT_885984 [Mycena floridula]|nr:hypothetical protein C8J56DRAFT_885984 [Mycena floridula]